METRQCSKCSEVKPIEEYYTIYNKKTNQKPYTYRYCKKCHYKMTKKNRQVWVKNNPKKAKKVVAKAMKYWRDRCTAGIYLIYTDIGRYIGSSDSIELRIAQHQSPNQRGGITQKGAKFLRYEILELEDRPKIRLRKEKKYIKTLQPELNIVWK